MKENGNLVYGGRSIVINGVCFMLIADGGVTQSGEISGR